MPLYMAVAGRIGSNRIAADRYGSWPTVRPVLTILALLLIFPFFIAFLFFFPFLRHLQTLTTHLSSFWACFMHLSRLVALNSCLNMANEFVKCQFCVKTHFECPNIGGDPKMSNTVLEAPKITLPV